MTARASPYQGLHAFSEHDAEFFFGREREGRIVTSNLLAYRLTLLYGESGVGKSSILGAGVVHNLHRVAGDNRARHHSSELAVIVCSEWIDPLASLKASVAAVAGDPGGNGTFLEAVDALCRRVDGEVLLVLDQFEEYFLYHPDGEADDAFVATLSSLVETPGRRVNVLVAIREDALARLDRFKAGIPGLFDNYLRLAPLSREAASAAITQPIVRYNAQPGVSGEVTIEPELVDAVLDELVSGDVGVAGPGRGIGGTGAHAVETPYLQLVMSRLWAAETEQGSRELRRATLDGLGGARLIVRSHVAQILRGFTAAEQDVVAAILHELVTPSGTKVAHSVADLAEMSDLSLEQVRPVVEKLAGSAARILRPVASPSGPADADRFELFHDVLASAVLDWRFEHIQAQRDRRREQERKRVEAQRRKEIRDKFFRILALVLIVAVVVALGLALIAYLQRNSARDNRDDARANSLAAAAFAALPADPPVAAARADAALGIRTNHPAAAVALVEASSQLYVRGVLRGSGAALRPLPDASTLTSEGGLLVTASDDGTAAIWDLKRHRLLHRLRGHKGPVRFAAFSPDGRTVATAGADGTGRIWDVETGRELHRLGKPARPMIAVRFNHDGTRLVTADGLRATARIWSTATGARLAVLKPSVPVINAEFNRAGTRVVTSSIDGVSRIWDARTSRLLRQLRGHHGQPAVAAYDPSGRRLVTASLDDTARVWDAGTRATIAVLRHDAEVERAAFSPDGRRIVTASRSEARVWTASGDPVATLRGHHDTVNTAEFSPDGERVVTASDDQTARIWDAATGDELRELHGHIDGVSAALFTPSGRAVVTMGDDGTARVWDADTGMALRGHTDWVVDVSYSVDGRRVATAGADGTVRIWDVARARQILQLELGGFANAASFSADGTIMLTAGSDGTARLWDARSGRLERVLRHPEGTFDVLAAALSPDARKAVTAPGGSELRLWDLATGLIRTLTGSGTMLDATFSPNGRLVAGASLDHTARIWDAATGKTVAVLRGHQGGVYSVAFSPDGRSLVTGSGDRTAIVWSVPQGRKLRELRGHTARLTSAVFTADARRVITAGDNSVRVWDVRTGREMAILRMHGDVVNDVAVLSDGLIASASDDRTARLYRCGTCVSVARLDKVVAERLTQVLTPGERRALEGG